MVKRGEIDFQGMADMPSLFPDFIALPAQQISNREGKVKNGTQILPADQVAIFYPWRINIMAIGDALVRSAGADIVAAFKQPSGASTRAAAEQIG